MLNWCWLVLILSKRKETGHVRACVHAPKHSEDHMKKEKPSLYSYVPLFLFDIFFRNL